MFKRLFEMAKLVFGLAQDSQRNKAQIEELRKDFKALSERVRELTFEIRRVRADEAHEREKMALRLENALLRSERRLTSGNPRLIGSDREEE